MTAFTPSDRLTHLADLMHRAEMSNGSSVPSNWALTSTGSNFGITWSPQSAASGAVSYGSNAMDVNPTDNGGASTDVSRMDHRHRGVRLISSAGSNSLVGDINFIGQGSVGVTVSGQTIQFSGPGTTGAGSGGGGGSGALAAAVFGTGSDGDVTISVSTTLAPNRDYYYNNLTINTGVIVDADAVRIFVKGTLTLTGTAKLHCDGKAGGNGGNGTIAAGGSAGAAGSAGTTGNIGPAAVGLIGKVGGFNGNGLNGSNGGASTMGVQHSNAVAGGNSNVNTGGTAGTGATATQAAGEKPFAYPICVTVKTMDAQAFNHATMFGTAPSSGSGAGGSAAGGGGSGGSGASGNYLVVCARTITGSGTLSTLGGNGGTGGNGFNGTGGAGGGGGGNGGAGGFLCLIYGDRAGFSGTTSVAGGSGGNGGTGTGTGTSGGNGATGPSGHLVQFQMG